MTPEMDERREGLTLTLVLVLVTSIISYVAGAAGVVPWVNDQVGRLPTKSAQPPAASANGIDVPKLAEIKRAIEDQYVEEVPDERLNTGAVKGMVNSLEDRYSAYYTPQEYQSFVEHFETTFSGIGVHVELSQRTGLVTVVAPIKGSPGERAGLRSEDAIVKVDDRDITNMTLNEAVALIKGPKGTKVKLTIKREGEPELLEFTITRDTITVPILDYRMIKSAEGVGYIQFFEFNKGSAAQIQAAINDLKQQGMTRLILDLRQNPGGLLNEAVDISSIFVPGGQPVLHIVERGKEKQTIRSTGKQAWNMPLVVLVDGGSASASEILAGAIKDTKIGTLIGTKTFGKGSVQSFWEFSDGSGIKLTTAKYLTAGENSINGVGIDPHLVAENPEKVIPGEPGDPQLEAAIQQIKTMTR